MAKKRYPGSDAEPKEAPAEASDADALDIPSAPAELKYHATVEGPGPTPDMNRALDPTPPAPATPELPRVGIDVFAKVSGMKADQMAGFTRWAKRSKLAARTIPEWHQAVRDFDNRPV